jgi:predicted DNA-binding antitoxin AbrB/MazE fold protein
MTTQAVDAIFENGGFRPLQPLNLPLAEGQRVRLVVETPTETPGDLLELAAQVYDGLTESEIDEIEQIALERRNFFPERNPS